ncbi:dethiobiotin synthetase [Streptomyces hygroscopicus]|uniref:TIGR00725 family protein n=1 Tax=Streptomyces hygroscopicus TaxID=1912 RepID=UPI00223F9B5C|nr:TIGR00725 family protein [Streptomyces hygroscopicus]MCW7943976.1 dethiobiotin synthetase [Streptomyces hygroscopicus]
MAVQVAVCGPSRCGERELTLAYEVGRLIAQRGAVVVCGGHGGVMGAVAAGARSCAGLVVGVLPGADRSGAGQDLSVAVATGLGQARNNVIVNSADAVVVVGGSWGTLSELALAMRRGGVPVVRLGDGWRIVDADGREPPGVLSARTPAEALDLTGLWD